VDIFALGVTAYELLAFELPWPWAEATGRGALTHDTESPVPLVEAAPWINRTLAEAITECMVPDRERRTKSLDVFLGRIQRLKDERES
jgi:hypothetical protein